MQTTGQGLMDRWKTLSKCVCDGARLVVGQGDYTAYAEHIRRTHPDRQPMTELEYFRNRENARFGVGNTSGFRCC